MICTITNTAVPPSLTLVKVVDNGRLPTTARDEGTTAVNRGDRLAHRQRSDIDRWTDRRLGGDQGGWSRRVVKAVVKVGDYSLGESGPSGYSAGDWSCAAGQQAGGTLTLGAGDNATCTITNTAIPGTWLLTKSADPSSDTVVPPGTTITYQHTATHQTGVAVIGAVATDHPTQVLSYSSLEEPLTDRLSLSGLSGRC